jgi:peptidoglycan/LPS O-acetylase OafA/YrhL
MASGLNADRYYLLDGLRAISILLVLACHLLPLGPAVLRFNEAAGAMGMSLFFALSGFLITSRLLDNTDIVEFLTRRLARILPLSYTYTLVVFTVIYFSPVHILWTDLFTINYMRQYLVSGLNNHLWSLCVEIHFYVAIGLAVALAGRRAIWLVWPACLLVTLLRFQQSAYLAIETHLRVDEILAGACVATALASLPALKNVARIRLVMFGAAACWAVASHSSAGSFQCLRPYATAVLLFASIQYGRVSPNTVLCSRPLRYIADISYALYVIHPATAYGWMNEGGSYARYFLKRPISFVLTFGLAHLSTFHLERNAQNFAKAWLRKRRADKLVAAAPASEVG